MNQKKIHKIILFCLIMLMGCGILSGCAGPSQSPVTTTKVNTKVTADDIGYDSSFTGVLQGIDRKEKECTFFDIKTGNIKQLSFTGAASIRSRYDKEQSSAYLEPGRIFDVFYEEGEKKIVRFEENKEAFEYRKVEDITFNNSDYIISMIDKKFSFDDSMMIFYGDNEITQIELNRQDELTVRGMGTMVYSVQVTKGHGYISFVNYDDFIGGYVSLGERQVYSVTEDMLLAAREGSYELSMENGELSGNKRVVVEKDKRIVVDMGEFRMEPERIGNIQFIISPANADLYINDTLVDKNSTVKLNFGIHKVKAVMDGYQDFNGVLTVSGNEPQTIEISLAKSENDKVSIGNGGGSQLVEAPDRDENNHGGNGSTGDGAGNGGNGDNEDEGNGDAGDAGNGNDEDEGNGNGGSNGGGNGGGNRNDTEHTITIKGPAGANVYMDGALIGTAPVSTEKIIGDHTITLYKSGYITKSYDIEVEDDGEDLTLEFPALLTGFE